MVGACSLRYMQVTAPADLDIINANVQLNGGQVAFEASACSVSSALLTVRTGHRRGTGIQLSFNLKRYCSSGSLTYTSALNGMSFSGSAISAVNYTALNPWYEKIKKTRDGGRVRDRVKETRPPRFFFSALVLGSEPGMRVHTSTLGFGRSFFCAGSRQRQRPAIRTRSALAAHASASQATSATALPARVRAP